MTPPELSVVVPCRLAGAACLQMRGAFLKLCLAALACQTAVGAFEVMVVVVVVVDGSDIDLAGFVSDFAGELGSLHVRVVRNTGSAHGQSAAYNVGIAEARGRLVLLCTDDSLLAPAGRAPAARVFRPRVSAVDRRLPPGPAAPGSGRAGLDHIGLPAVAGRPNLRARTHL